MLKKHILNIALFYTIILIVVSFANISKVPDFNYSNTDKIYHFIAYSILSGLWFAVFMYKFKQHFYKSLLFAVTLSILFGIIIEILQGVLTNIRVTDSKDVLANSLGACFTIIVLILFKKKRRSIR